MHKLPLAIACYLAVTTITYAATETDVESNSSATAFDSIPDKGALKNPKTYQHTDNKSAQIMRTEDASMTSMDAKNMSFSNCYITIRNEGLYDMVVYGRYDDGTYLNTFTLPWYSSYVAYVDLYFYGYCHGGMEFYIDTTDGTYKYSGYTPVGKTIKVR